MNQRLKIPLLLLILVPLAVGLAGQPLAAAVQYSTALQAINSAQNSGDPRIEKDALSVILEFKPWRGDLWQRLGRLSLDRGESQEAVGALEQAAEMQQLNDQGVVWLAEALFSTGHAEEAGSVLRNLSSNDPSILMQSAATMLKQTRSFDASIALLEKASAAAPGDESVAYQLGLLNMVVRPADALVQLRSISKESEFEAKAAYLADTIAILDDSGVYEGWYTAAGQALTTVGEWDAAVAAFTLVTEADPQDAFTWALLAEAQQLAGDDGAESLERALTLDPADEMVNGMAGLYYRRIGDSEKALAYLQKALAVNPDAVAWQIAIGGTLADAGRVEEALVAFYDAIEIDRGNTESWAALAKFSLNRNYRVEEDGLPAARQLVLLEPGNPVYLDLLGTAYLALGDPDSAERFFLQALTLDPEQAAILIHLGQTSLTRGDLEEGFAYLRRALAAAEDERLREMAERLLAEYGAK